MSEKFQKHLLKCWYSECDYNQNLMVSNSAKLRGLQMSYSNDANQLVESIIKNIHPSDHVNNNPSV